jgi:glycosyltransferase involved in cell wall biosynthesis
VGVPTETSARPAVAVVIPAKDEEARIAATVAGAKQIAGVDLVVVVDDGSSDRTAVVAAAAGAEVVRHDRNRGKAAAMESGADAAAAHGDRLLLFLDADLESSAARAAPLVPPVQADEADMTIALLPAQSSAGGGHGFVVRLATRGIARATGWTPTQPLSGQRCLTLEAFAAARPLARGFGVETGLTIDLLLKDFREIEVPCDLHHRVTGTDARAQLHRARQYRDVARALAKRGILPARFDRASQDAARLGARIGQRFRRD